MRLMPFLYGCVIGSLLFAVGAWFVDGAVWIPSLVQFGAFLAAAVIAEAGKEYRRAPVDTDTAQIAFLRERYVKGDIEVEEFERDLDRLLRPAGEAFPLQRLVVAGTDGRGRTYCFDSRGDIHPC